MAKLTNTKHKTFADLARHVGEAYKTTNAYTIAEHDHDIAYLKEQMFVELQRLAETKGVKAIDFIRVVQLTRISVCTCLLRQNTLTAG